MCADCRMLLSFTLFLLLGALRSYIAADNLLDAAETMIEMIGQV
jgi:hypothetical protein